MSRRLLLSSDRRLEVPIEGKEKKILVDEGSAGLRTRAHFGQNLVWTQVELKSCSVGERWIKWVSNKLDPFTTFNSQFLLGLKFSLFKPNSWLAISISVTFILWTKIRWNTDVKLLIILICQWLQDKYLSTDNYSECGAKWTIVWQLAPQVNLCSSPFSYFALLLLRWKLTRQIAM